MLAYLRRKPERCNGDNHRTDSLLCVFCSDMLSLAGHLKPNRNARKDYRGCFIKCCFGVQAYHELNQFSPHWRVQRRDRERHSTIKVGCRFEIAWAIRRCDLLSLCFPWRRFFATAFKNQSLMCAERIEAEPHIGLANRRLSLAIRRFDLLSPTR